MKDCKNCYWYEQCKNEIVENSAEDCDDYTPIEDSDEVAIEEYEKDLKERARIYQELVDEQNR